MEKDSTVGDEFAHEKRLFTAALFLSGRPLDISLLSKILDPFNLENRLLEYAEEFNEMSLGLRIRNVSGGFQMVTDPEVAGELAAYFGEKPETISKSSLETLAVIAYKQPVTKAETEKVRGVDCSGSIKTLLERNLISVSGRRNVPGRPLLYVTTKYFMEYFGLNDISELPTFREWQELKNS